jgi:D-glycero-alpha-D-manno-heptose-7-phosphate kinase|tara:strand:+ start:202 stop:1185 length:984 start_codon:yes stop_codon:yes gene_type:complete
MIITKTPYRISFFGGGSDYPIWYKKFGGSVLSTTIDKYIYISCRELPPFFDHKYRIVWSKIENVKTIDEIKHLTVRKLIKYNKIKSGLEIHYDGDLPARSGMGSSSSFSVGLMRALSNYQHKDIKGINLAYKTIPFEQKIMNETVGSQDQVAASVGGFNRINFLKNEKIIVKKVLSNNLRRLNSNLLLLYTGIQRNADAVASNYVHKLSNEKEKNVRKIISNVELGEKMIKSGNINDFGKLLHHAWMEKKELSKSISNHKIDELYKSSIQNGALGGKLLGAGGGGFLLVYINKKKQKNFLSKIRNITNIPFKFSNEGCEVILNSLNK